eukprot:1831253-Alexandrium_andersonii.AAC.1
MAHCKLWGPPTCTPPGIGGGSPRIPTRGAPTAYAVCHLSNGEVEILRGLQAEYGRRSTAAI